MILQALVKYYDSVLSEKVPDCWQQRKAAYIIDIDDNGNILNSSTVADISDLMPEAPKGKTTSVKAAFLCDNGAYLFGMENEKDKTKNGAAKYIESRKIHLDVLKNATGSTSLAIKAFFQSDTPKVPPTGVDKNTLCVFAVNGKKAYEFNEVKKAWDDYQANNSKPSSSGIIDLVSGKKDTIARLHGSIKGLGKDSPSLINVNQEAFASYGKTKKDPAANIGEQTAFKYVTALNSLISDKNHKSRIADSYLIYWAEDGEGEEEKVFADIWETKADATDSAKLNDTVNAIINGKPVCNCNMDSTFYLLCLALQSKRIVVRFFYRNTFNNIISNIKKHYENLQITNDDFSQLTPFHILGNTVRKKKGGQYGDAPPLLGGQLLNAIISGSRYPMTLYNAILTRIRAGEDIHKTKAAIVKAVLIRNFSESEVTTMALNMQTDNQPYVLGRLFATLERLQKAAAGGKLNATIRDKYFATACANPASVFPTILKLSMHHFAKLKNSELNEKLKEAYYCEKLKTELLGRLDAENPFPKALSLDDQGRFILGYYQQRNFLPNKEKTEEETNV